MHTRTVVTLPPVRVPGSFAPSPEEGARRALVRGALSCALLAGGGVAAGAADDFLAGALGLFLGGVVLMIWSARPLPNLALAGILAIVPVGVGSMALVSLAPFGIVADLGSGPAPERGVAGYRVGPGWRIAPELFGAAAIRTRGSGSRGQFVVAPLVPPGWTEADPVPVWVLTRRPDERDRSPPAVEGRADDREYARAIGDGSTRRVQIEKAVERAVASHGLAATGPSGPVVVEAVASVREALRAQLRRVLTLAGAGFALWTGATLLIARLERRRLGRA